jgi:hypothetical protein
MQLRLSSACPHLLYLRVTIISIMRSGNYMQSSYYIVCVRHIAHIFNFGDNSQDNQLLIDAAKFGERTAVIGEAIITYVTVYVLHYYKLSVVSQLKNQLFKKIPHIVEISFYNFFIQHALRRTIIMRTNPILC